MFINITFVLFVQLVIENRTLYCVIVTIISRSSPDSSVALFKLMTSRLSMSSSLPKINPHRLYLHIFTKIKLDFLSSCFVALTSLLGFLKDIFLAEKIKVTFSRSYSVCSPSYLREKAPKLTFLLSCLGHFYSPKVPKSTFLGSKSQISVQPSNFEVFF